MRIHLRDGLPTESKALAPMVGQCEASSVGILIATGPERQIWPWSSIAWVELQENERLAGMP